LWPRVCRLLRLGQQPPTITCSSLSSSRPAGGHQAQADRKQLRWGMDSVAEPGHADAAPAQRGGDIIDAAADPALLRLRPATTLI
jgi:hypothetical protein